MTTLLESALAYAKAGKYVFPLSPGTKIPFAGSRGHLDATIDQAQIQAWWKAAPNANIGLSLEPSGLVVLDVDVGEGKRGYSALQQLYGIEIPPATLTAYTMSGGMHFLFTRPEGVPAKRKIDFQQHLQPEHGKGSGLDLLGNGFIVVHPSVSAKTGKTYSWANSIQPVPLPTFLAKTYFAAAPQVERDRNAVESDIIEGGRNTALFRLGCSVRDLGVSEDSLHHTLTLENEARCNPPIPAAELARIVSQVMAHVAPSRDVLEGSVLLDALQPVNTAVNLLVRDPGRLSVSVQQLADFIPQPITMRKTGIGSLDALSSGGFVEGDLSVLIGPPGTGKTSLALKLCATPPPSLYVSSELSAEELKARIASEQLGVPWLDIMTGKVSHEDIRRALVRLNIQIMGQEDLEYGSNGTPLNTPQEKVRAIAEEALYIRELTQQTPLIVIDYIQDMARKCDSRDPVGDISLLLRKLAKGMKAPVLAVSSTSRTWYGQHPEITNPSGFLAGGKESGSIEYDAATVWYLDLLEEMSQDHQLGRIAVCKSRHARTGFIGMSYYGAKGGQWVESDKALPKFEELVEGKGKRGEASTQNHGADNQSVLEYLAKIGTDPINVIKFNLGIPAGRARSAIDRLLQEKKIRVITEIRIGADHRHTSVQVLAKVT